MSEMTHCEFKDCEKFKDYICFNEYLEVCPTRIMRHVLEAWKETEEHFGITGKLEIKIILKPD